MRHGSFVEARNAFPHTARELGALEQQYAAYLELEWYERAAPLAQKITQLESDLKIFSLR